MKKIVVSIFLLSSSMCFAQQKSKPFLLNKSVLSGVGLEKIELKDEPEKDFFQKQLYRGQDLSIYVVSTETWNNRFKNFWFDEFIYMYHGEALIKPEKGRSQLFHSGEYFFAPRGFTGEWEIRAGNGFHYELSVIATHRVDSSRVNKIDKHCLFDQSILSGAHIDLSDSEMYSKVLKKGAELTISLLAQRPMSYDFQDTKEQLIQLLSGQVSIVDVEGNEHQYYTGDFFVLPKDCDGKWTSKGHGLVKFLTVQKSD